MTDETYLTIEEFKKVFESKGAKVRVVSVDGNPVDVTRDYDPDRLNVHVVNGRVVKVDGWY